MANVIYTLSLSKDWGTLITQEISNKQDYEKCNEKSQMFTARFHSKKCSLAA